MLNKVDSKEITFPVKIRDIRKIEKENSIGFTVFGYGKKEKYPIYISNKMLWKKRVDLLMIGREGQRHYVLIKILILSCRIILYIVEENIFVVIVYKLLV